MDPYSTTFLGQERARGAELQPSIRLPFYPPVQCFFSNEAISYQDEYFQRHLLFKTKFINPSKNTFSVFKQLLSFLAEPSHCRSLLYNVSRTRQRRDNIPTVIPAAFLWSFLREGD